MRVIIARYYKTAKKATKCANDMCRLWKGKIAWYVVCAENGYFVISESMARKCYPALNFDMKDRRYIVHR